MNDTKKTSKSKAAKRLPLEEIWLPAGTVIKIEAMPFRLKEDTPVLGTKSNLSCTSVRTAKPPKREYQADIAIPPWDSIIENFEFFNITERPLIFKWLNLKDKDAQRLIQGTLRIDDVLAARLQTYLFSPAQFWKNLDRQYVETLARLKKNKLKTLPL